MKNFLLLLPIFIAACTSTEKNDTPVIPASGLPFTLAQRTSVTPVEHLKISIGDITHGRTNLRITFKEVLVVQQSVSEGTLIPFTLSGKEYMLICINLHNVLIGEDTGEFILRNNSYEPPSTPRANEEQKIEALLKTIETADIVFIRNGEEYTAAEAAAHLRKKYDSAKDRITTREQFVEEIASASSMTGEPYKVKLKDGLVMTVREWIRSMDNHNSQGTIDN